MQQNENKIKPIAIPGIHKAFLNFFKKNTGPGIKVLDAGTGHGAMAESLFQAGYDVTACDFNEDIYYLKNIPFVKADITKALPFENENFDAVVAVEVMEHIFDHEVFFSEAARILTKNGKLFFSTPNILSLKSRWRYFFSGYFYSFQKLNYQNQNGLQHITSLTFDQYIYLAEKHGFTLKTFSFDKKQNLSKALMFFYPFLKIYGKLKSTGNFHNSPGLLTGRVILMMLEKKH